jgi:hypothetical protein
MPISERDGKGALFKGIDSTSWDSVEFGFADFVVVVSLSSVFRVCMGGSGPAAWTVAASCTRSIDKIIAINIIMLNKFRNFIERPPVTQIKKEFF